MNFKQILEVMSLLHLTNAVFGAGGKYNITYEILDRCKEFDAVSGYNYRTYFELSDLKHSTPKDDELIKINLIVLGSKDAHILLTPAINPESNAAVYEIVLGAGANSFCEIRRKRKVSPLKNKRVQVLSPIDPVPITIRITRSGIIEVTIRGDILPLISAEDSDPIVDLKYISFSTWGSTSVKFFYDCPDTTTEQQLTPIEPPMSTQERIIKDIFRNYDTFSLPQLDEEIMIESFSLKSVRYDEQKSLLTSRVVIKLSWNDSRLMWDPTDYDNISAIRNPAKGSFWRPSLMLMNGVLEVFKSLDIQYTFTLHYHGIVTAESKNIEISTLCFPGESMRLHDWPSSEMGCYIQLMSQGVSLAGFDNSIKLDSRTESAWMVSRVSEDDDYVVNHLPILEYETFAHMDGKPKTPRMCVSYVVYLKQNQSYFKMLFRVPLFASLICLCLSTITRKTIRFAFISTGFLIICVSLLSLTKFAPTFYKSTFAIHHEVMLVLCWISILFGIFNSWCYDHPPETLPPLWIGKVVNFYWLRFTLGLQYTGSYDFLQKRSHAWQELDDVVDRIWFVALTIYGVVLVSTC